MLFYDLIEIFEQLIPFQYTEEFVYFFKVVYIQQNNDILTWIMLSTELAIAPLEFDIIETTGDFIGKGQFFQLFPVGVINPNKKKKESKQYKKSFYDTESVGLHHKAMR